MLRRHFDYIEKLILAQSSIVDEAGHAIHKGTPREYFIKDFLSNHIGKRVAFGTGEIIDANSQPGDKRNQIDIVIYRPDYPKLNLGGEINVFLAESVIATIEVKSLLNEETLKNSIEVANKIKKLNRETPHIRMGYVPPSIVSYVVAYDGPASMQTIYGWLNDIHKTSGITLPDLPADRKRRSSVACPSVDGVFVLGKGFLYFDNTFTGYTSNEIHKQHPDTKWIYADSESGNAYLLFIFLTSIVSSFLTCLPSLTPYLKGANVQLKWGN